MKGNEHDLVKLILDGRTEVFESLIEKYQDRLASYIRRYIRDMDDVEDILQEVFFKAYRSLSSWHGTSMFSTWLFSIAHNEALSFLKKHHHYDKNKDLESLSSPVSDELEDINELVNNVLDELETRYRGPLHLFYREKRSYLEIAEICSRPLNTVKSDLLRGKELIRQILSEKYHVDSLW